VCGVVVVCVGGLSALNRTPDRTRQDRTGHVHAYELTWYELDDAGTG
jgi:hypothetical protein